MGMGKKWSKASGALVASVLKIFILLFFTPIGFTQEFDGPNLVLNPSAETAKVWRPILNGQVGGPWVFERSTGKFASMLTYGGLEDPLDLGIDLPPRRNSHVYLRAIPEYWSNPFNHRPATFGEKFHIGGGFELDFDPKGGIRGVIVRPFAGNINDFGGEMIFSESQGGYNLVGNNGGKVAPQLWQENSNSIREALAKQFGIPKTKVQMVYGRQVSRTSIRARLLSAGSRIGPGFAGGMRNIASGVGAAFPEIALQIFARTMTADDPTWQRLWDLHDSASMSPAGAYMYFQTKYQTTIKAEQDEYIATVNAILSSGGLLHPDAIRRRNSYLHSQRDLNWEKAALNELQRCK